MLRTVDKVDHEGLASLVQTPSIRHSGDNKVRASCSRGMRKDMSEYQLERFDTAHLAR